MFKFQRKESQSPRGLIQLFNMGIKTDAFLNCANCGACKEVCPSNVEFDIEKMRQAHHKNRESEKTLQVLKNIQKYDNPYGIQE